MADHDGQPLLTFAVFAFQQERFIEAAVAGALGQTYSPLEVILSDDGSSDQTYRRMCEMAAGYRGPHRVRLRQNPRNTGLCEHVNQVVRESNGVLVIGSAGDDISMPERSEWVFRAWLDSGRRATSICSRYSVVDDAGRPADYPEQIIDRQPGQAGPFVHCLAEASEFVRRRRPHVSGCTHAFSPVLFRKFSPLPSWLTYEDTALAFRSVLAGSITIIDRELVRYRRHGSNLYAPLSPPAIGTPEESERYRQQCIREAQRFVLLYRCFRQDLETALRAGWMNEAQHRAIGRLIDRQAKIFSLRARFHQSRLAGRWAVWAALLFAGANRGLLRRLGPELLPRRLPRHQV